MAKTQQAKTLLSLLLAFTLAFSGLLPGFTTSMAAESVTLAEWNQSVKTESSLSSVVSTNEKGVYKDESSFGLSTGGQFSSTAGSASYYYAVNNLTAWQFELKTAGYKNITLAFKAYGTSAVSPSWKAQYSTDKTTYSDFADNEYKIDTTNKAANAVQVNLNFGEWANDAEKLYIRLVPEANGGNSRLVQPIIVTGESIEDSIGDIILSTPTDNNPVVNPPAPDISIVTIAEARKMPVDTKNVMIKGVATYKPGTSDTLVNLQDDTAAITLYGLANGSAYIGKKITVTGDIGAYKGLVQLKNISSEVLVDETYTDGVPAPKKSRIPKPVQANLRASMCLLTISSSRRLTPTAKAAITTV